MRQRLQLIWYALTAPVETVEQNIETVEKNIDRNFLIHTIRRLNLIRQYYWSLEGISLSHTSADINSDDIHDFLRDAPMIIETLVNMLDNRLNEEKNNE